MKSQPEAGVVYTPNHPALVEPSQPNFSFLEGGHCSKYARLVARLLFNLEYERAHAWNLAAENKRVWSADNDQNLRDRLREMHLNAEDLYSKKVEDFTRKEQITINNAIISRLEGIQPGCIVGCYFSGSSHNNKKRPYTHVLLYVGRDKKGKHITFHQFEEGFYLTSLEDLIVFEPVSGEGHCIIPREVIAPKQ